MTFNTLIEEKDAGVRIITLNRPNMMNALNTELMEEMDEILNQIEADDETRVVIITGNERFFAVGADINEVEKISSTIDAYRFAKKAQTLLIKLSNIRQPVIAAVSGLALGGGCEICLACDIRIASENANFGFPEIKLSLIPAGGGTQRLPRLVGMGKAKELLFSGESIDAQEAYRIGLVNMVVPSESLMAEAKKMAKKFVRQPGYALMLIKNLVNEGLNMDLNSALVHESRNLQILFSTEDQKEGVRAFIEKRKPVFKNR